MILSVKRSLLIFFLLLSSCTKVYAVTNSFDLWANLTLNLKKDKFLYHFMVNPRLNDNWTRYDKQFIRNGIGYELKPGFSVMLGHDWFHINQTTDDIDYENRIWQQIQYNNKIAKLKMLNRLRLEERFLEDEFLTSLRWLIRFDYPLIKKYDIDLVFSNEIFVDLNRDFRFAENRIFAGFNKKFTENLNLDLGYQLRHLNQIEDSLSHAVLFNLVYNLNL